MKRLTLAPLEEIAFIKPVINSSPGNNPIVLGIRSASGEMRHETILPEHFSPDVRLLYNSFAAAYESMRAAVTKLITR